MYKIGILENIQLYENSLYLIRILETILLCAHYLYLIGILNIFEWTTKNLFKNNFTRKVNMNVPWISFRKPQRTVIPLFKIPFRKIVTFHFNSSILFLTIYLPRRRADVLPSSSLKNHFPVTASFTDPSRWMSEGARSAL